jgi:hypothetical protein
MPLAAPQPGRRVMYAAVAGFHVRRHIQGVAFAVLIKAPLAGGAVVLIVNDQRTLLRDNVGSAGAFLATFGIKRYLLSFCQGFEATGLDGGMMNEYVIAAVRRTDESKAFTIVKPLHCACRHTGYLFQKLISNEIANSLMPRNYGRVC